MTPSLASWYALGLRIRSAINITPFLAFAQICPLRDKELKRECELASPQEKVPLLRVRRRGPNSCSLKVIAGTAHQVMPKLRAPHHSIIALSNYPTIRLSVSHPLTPFPAFSRSLSSFIPHPPQGTFARRAPTHRRPLVVGRSFILSTARLPNYWLPDHITLRSFPKTH